MKYIIGLILSGFVLIIGCNTATRSKIFTEGSIAPEQFNINTDKDTTLQTKNGALLKIPKGALSVDGGIARLEIKEAYSIQQMIQSGLITNSNGEPLSSGGMIYINAAGGQKITINQPIKVAIPTDHLEKDMQLFKGEKDKDGNINWKDPVALPENKQLSAADRGKVLFQNKCSSCHVLGKALTGPDLAHFVKRFPLPDEGNHIYYGHLFDQLEKDSTDDHRDYYKPKDPNWYYHNVSYLLYKCNLIQSVGGVAGPVFIDDSTNYLSDIYRYIQNESDRLKLPMPAQTGLKDCVDSCQVYNNTVKKLNEQKELTTQKRRQLVKENGDMVIDIPQRSNNNLPPPTPPNFEDKVSPENFEAEYYQFTIESFGWFNIDILLKNVDGVQNSELIVRIVGEYRQKVEVYLIIPSKKVYGEGGKTGRNEDEFAFYTKDGKIPLPQNARAYILAMSETKIGLAYVIKEFNTTTQQRFDISLKPSTMEEFKSVINNLNFDQLNIKVAETKNAAEIRESDLKLEKIDNEIKKAEGLKPKGCDCDCLTKSVDQPVRDTAKIQ